MALQGRIGADFGDFTRALSDLKGKLNDFSSSTTKLQSDLNRLTQNFGGDKIRREAELMAKAVEQVGGSAKLTASHQAQVSATMREAIEWYRRAGQEPPAHLRKLADETRQLEKATTAGGVSIRGMIAGYAGGMLTFAAAQRALRGTVEFIKGSVQAYAEEELAIKKVTTALQVQGMATPRVIADYKAMASAIQQTTVYGDELILEMQALLVEIGGVAPGEMKKALDASTDLAAGLGIDLKTATQLVGKAFAGEMGTLKRYGIVIDEATLKARGIDAVLDAINSKMGGQAAAQADTFTGKIQQLSNAWGDLKEKIGLAIAEQDGFFDKVTDRSTNALVGLTQLVEHYGLLGTLGMLAPMMVPGGGTGPVQGIAGAMAGGSYQGGGGTDIDLDAEARARAKREQAVADEAAKKAAEQHAKAVQALYAQLSGGKLNAEMKTLLDAYRQLTPAQREDTEVTGRLMEAYEKLRKQTSALPAELEAYYQVHTEVLRSSESWLSTLRQTSTVGLPGVADGAAKVRYLMAGLAEDGTIRVSQSFADIAMQLPDVTGKMQDAGGGARDLAGSVASVAEELGKATPKLSAWDKALADMWAGLPNVMLRAFEGGGDAGKAIGAYVGGEIGGGLRTSLAPMLGGRLGSLLGGMIPGAGALLGSFAGAALDKVGGWLSKSEGRHTNDLRDQFIGAAGGLGVLNERAHEAGMNLHALLAAGDEQGLRRAIADLEAGFARFDERIQSVSTNLSNIGLRGGLITDSVLQELATLRDNPQVRAALAEFMEGQTTRGAGALTAIAQPERWAKRQEAQAAYDAAVESGDSGRIARAQKDLEEASLGVPKFTSEAGAAGVGAGAAALAAQMREQGAGAREIAETIGPVIETLRQKFEEAGLSGGEAFQRLAYEMGYLASEGVGPLLDSASGVTQLMTTLYNTGRLNEETFTGLARQVADTKAELDAMGKGGEDALNAMQPDLQRIWEMQKKFGWEVDDATQTLLDEAEAAGLIGEKFRPATDRMIDAIDRMIDRFDEFLDRFDLIPRDINVGVNYQEYNRPTDNRPTYRAQSDMETETAHTGGLMTWTGLRRYHAGGLAPDERPAIVQVGERILSKTQTGNLDALLSALKVAAGSSRPININVRGEIDGRELVRFTSRATDDNLLLQGIP